MVNEEIRLSLSKQNRVVIGKVIIELTTMSTQIGSISKNGVCSDPTTNMDIVLAGALYEPL